MGDFGLRNKRELWRYKTMLSEVRGIARSLLGSTGEQRVHLEQEYLSKLGRMGVLSESATIDDVLDLDIRDLLERRLQTMVFRKGLAKTLFQARQFVSHGHITVAGKIISVPGYIVKRDEEGKLKYFSQSPLSKADHSARKGYHRNRCRTSRGRVLVREPVFSVEERGLSPLSLHLRIMQ